MGVSGLNQILSNFCLLVAKIDDGFGDFWIVTVTYFLSSFQMNPLSHYNRSKEPWLPDEAAEVKRRYNDESKNILEIADIHQRTPGCIAYKLQSMAVIPHNRLARGYQAYTISPLYNEVVQGYRIQKEERQKIKKERDTVKVDKAAKIIENASLYEINSLKGEIHNIKSDIAEMKRDIKELLECMKAVYEFEDAPPPPPNPFD